MSRKRSAGDIQLEIIIEDNASPNLGNTTELSEKLENMQKIEAEIANKFATGELQAEFQSVLNVTVSNLGVQSPATAEAVKPVSKVSKIVVVSEAGECSAQTPCKKQPSLMVVDENVNSFLKYYFHE